MRLSPLQIKRQEFSKKFRGLDEEEVSSFLEKIAQEFEDIHLENESLKKQVEETAAQLAEFRRIEKNLQETLLKAQENSSKAIESTKKQSSLMMKEAEIKSQQIIDKAKEQANEIRNSIIVMREERDVIISRLKAIVTSQANLLEIKVEKAGEETPQQPEKKVNGPNKKRTIDIGTILDKMDE